MCAKVVNLDYYRKLKLPENKLPYRERITTPEMGFKHIKGGFASFPPGGSVEYHYHRNTEHVLIVVSGEGTRTVEGKVFKLKPGDIIITTADERHDVRNTGTTELRYVSFSSPSSPQLDRIVVKETDTSSTQEP